MLTPFIFGEGQKARTPQELAEIQAYAESMAKRGRNPQNVGEGLLALGDGINAAIANNAAARGKAAGLQSAFGAMTPVAAALAGKGAFPAAPGAPGGDQAGVGTGGGTVPAPAPIDASMFQGADLDAHQKALLDTIAGPESAGAYDVIYGGSKFTDFSDHPRKAVPIASGPNVGKTSSAAGKYQFLGSTWDTYRDKLGLKDFSPASQDQAAWALAADTYKAKTGGDLAVDLQSGDPEKIAAVGRTLNGVWTSLPGGIEQGIDGNKFLTAYSSNLGKTRAPMPSATGGTQVASLDPSAGLPARDPYGAIPAVDGRGEDQRAKFREWNPDPIGGEAGNLGAIDPAMAKVIQRAKEIAGTDLVLGSGKRGADQQQKAVDWGWSKTMDSDHLGGGAADLWPVNERGEVEFDPARQAQIVTAMKQAAQELGVDMEAGADWKGFKDMPHFGMTNQTPMDAPVPTSRPGAPIPAPVPRSGQEAIEIALMGGRGAPQAAGASDAVVNALSQTGAALPAAAGPSAAVIEALRGADRAGGAAVNPQGAPAPALPAPRTVATPQVAPPAAAPRQRIEQALRPPTGPMPDMAGNTTHIDTENGPSMQQLMEAAANPWLNDSQRSLVNTLLQQKLAERDPATAMARRKAEIELRNLENPPEEFGFTTLPDGTVLRTSKRGGTAEPIYEAGPKPAEPFTLNGGQTRFDGAGRPIASGGPSAQPMTAEQRAQWNIPADDQRPYMMTPEGPKLIGGSGVTVNNNVGGEQLSPGQKKIDEAFADTYLSWNSGGFADSRKQLTQLGEALKILEEKGDVTGAIGMLPTQLQPFINPEGTVARENVEEVVQRSLREILGAQFTEKEGERLIQRAFNPLLSPQENAKRVRRLMGTIGSMADAKQDMVDYFDQNGTLRGYKGSRPTLGQIETLSSEFGESPEEKKSSASDEYKKRYGLD